jgi:streptogramin lyase
MMPKYYITRYALSSGIEEFDLPVDPDDDGRVWFIDQSIHRHHSYGRGEWHLNRSDAIIAADQSRLKKIASLKRSIAKLENMTFAEAKK